MLGRLLAWLDNPIFVKHVRSRLRPQAFFIVAGHRGDALHLHRLCGYAARHVHHAARAGMILALQTIMLVIMGAGQVGAVGQWERGPRASWTSTASRR